MTYDELKLEQKRLHEALSKLNADYLLEHSKFKAGDKVSYYYGAKLETSIVAYSKIGYYGEISYIGYKILKDGKQSKHHSNLQWAKNIELLSQDKAQT